MAQAGQASTGARLEDAARPLLELMHRLTGLETTFITGIDWTGQRQDVLVALNTAELHVAEGSRLDWADSMCRHVLLSGDPQSSDVPRDFPGSLGADVVGMQSFFAVPISTGHDDVVGTVCGASRRRVRLDVETLENMRLIGQALGQQLLAERELTHQQERNAELEQQALTDVLTGLPNRRAFIGRWEEEMARSARHDHPLALLMIDVDHFKEVNDEFGHAEGDRVLFRLGEVLRGVSRAEDVAARLGGDEFVLACMESDMVGALELAERVRADFSRLGDDEPDDVTLSIGISCSETTPLRSMLQAADQALYRSKEHGRDRVELWTGELTGVVDLVSPESRSDVRG